MSTCDDVDECALSTDNCDPQYGTCTNTDGSFSCACQDGFVGDGISCSCDMSGTFAVLNELDVQWSEVTAGALTIVSAGATTTYSWAIRRQTQVGDQLEIETVPCGGTSPDLCGTFWVGFEAYGQFIPNESWEQVDDEGNPTIDPTPSTATLSSSVPGGSVMGDPEASLLGLEIDGGPFSSWPGAWDDPDLTWTNPDVDYFDAAETDMKRGITSVMRGSGTSDYCGTDYAYVPMPDGSGKRVREVHLGSRAIGNTDGSIVSCDEMVGEVTGEGPGGFAVFNGRIGGCETSDGDKCTQSEWESLDAQADTEQQVNDSRFTMFRVSDDITCDEVRNFNFQTGTAGPPGWPGPP
ncbi:MAG: EGF-like domain-containing protein [Myxococcales bacterium]|nr:EGF-like domain-containing protein [Myxococcales bacterium]